MHKIKAAAMLSHLLTQAGLPQVKIDFIRFKIIPIILYMTQVSNWLLKQYHSLDAPFTENYRKLLSLPKQSPETIIHLLNKYCGIGLLKVSDLAKKYYETISSDVKLICPRHVAAYSTTDLKVGARFLACNILE
jgi:hypothetical protein